MMQPWKINFPFTLQIHLFKNYLLGFTCEVKLKYNLCHFKGLSMSLFGLKQFYLFIYFIYINIFRVKFIISTIPRN